ncbi:hypothetical protein TCAL_07342 [Tigriopus californicus]|uniref:Fibronectin type-II domain-containing protein n=1 Tax=Tigriopus californicus TaxID=6832 RepID=A0A553NZF2_TIGCA|nr:hypothetical protein TCAL_07342 [Tigriopus californicus]
MIELNWWVLLVLEVFWLLFNPLEIVGLQVRAPCYSIVSMPSGGFHECLGSFFYQTRLYDGCSSINGIWQCSIANDDNFVAREMANCSRECIDDLLSPCSTTQTIGDHGVQFQGSPCEFPFHYHGRNYYSCTAAGHSELWCTIHKNHSTLDDISWSWGPCGPECFADKHYSCRTTDDKVCQFPFVYQDETYNECTHVGHDNPWCPIVVDEYGHATEHWGNCRDECPGNYYI